MGRVLNEKAGFHFCTKTNLYRINEAWQFTQFSVFTQFLENLRKTFVEQFALHFKVRLDLILKKSYIQNLRIISNINCQSNRTDNIFSYRCKFLLFVTFDLLTARSLSVLDFSVHNVILTSLRWLTHNHNLIYAKWADRFLIHKFHFNHIKYFAKTMFSYFHSNTRCWELLVAGNILNQYVQRLIITKHTLF